MRVVKLTDRHISTIFGARRLFATLRKEDAGLDIAAISPHSAARRLLDADIASEDRLAKPPPPAPRRH